MNTSYQRTVVFVVQILHMFVDQTFDNFLTFVCMPLYANCHLLEMQKELFHFLFVEFGNHVNIARNIKNRRGILNRGLGIFLESYLFISKSNSPFLISNSLCLISNSNSQSRCSLPTFATLPWRMRAIYHEKLTRLQLSSNKLATQINWALTKLLTSGNDSSVSVSRNSVTLNDMKNG